MENTLPFEYGFLYKTIENPNQAELSTGIRVENSYNSWWNNSGNSAISGMLYSGGIDHSKYFHPIGYIASKQIVIVEVMVTETEKINGLLTMNSMSFSTTGIEKSFTKIARANIDVNIFIKNFEKVL